jgi:hypothetical protein
MTVMPRRRNPRTPPRRAQDDERLPGAGSHWRRDGTSKVAYMSRGEALLVAEERSRETGLSLDVYECPVCSAWHMGNPIEGAGEQPRRRESRG